MAICLPCQECAHKDFLFSSPQCKILLRSAALTARKCYTMKTVFDCSTFVPRTRRSGSLPTDSGLWPSEGQGLRAHSHDSHTEDWTQCVHVTESLTVWRHCWQWWRRGRRSSGRMLLPVFLLVFGEVGAVGALRQKTDLSKSHDRNGVLRELFFVESEGRSCSS